MEQSAADTHVASSDMMEKIFERMESLSRSMATIECKVSALDANAACMQQNEELFEQILSLERQKRAFEVEKMQTKTEYCDAMKRIDEQQVKITEFEKKTNNSCIIGQIGEENVRQVLEGLKHHWGDGIDYERTSGDAFSGDFLLHVRTTVAGCDKVFTVLIDSKKRKSGVSAAHFTQAVRDAKHVKADAILVVYSEMGKRDYPRGLEEAAELNKEWDGFRSNMVKGCILPMLQVALSKLLLEFNPVDKDMLNKVDTLDALRASGAAWRATLAVIAPILHALDPDEMKKQSAIAQQSMIAFKNQLRHLSGDAAAEHHRLLTFVFPGEEGRKGMRSKTSMVLGELVSPVVVGESSEMLLELSGDKRPRQ